MDYYVNHFGITDVFTNVHRKKLCRRNAFGKSLKEKSKAGWSLGEIESTEAQPQSNGVKLQRSGIFLEKVTP